MVDLDWMTTLTERTIGARRGRAGRGSPPKPIQGAVFFSFRIFP